MLAPPCGSFSSVNASVSRTHEDPWGLQEQPSAKARISVDCGNSCARAALRVIRALEQYQIPWILEHPRSSRLWWTEQFRAFAAKSHISVVHCHQCQFGARWRKATSFMCSRFDDIEVQQLGLRCSGRHACSKTGKAHITLQGLAPCGKPWTSLAAGYPKKLYKTLAKLLLAHARSSINVFPVPRNSS